MIELIYTTYSYRVLKLVTGYFVVCLLAIAVPTESFACHRNTAGGDPKPHGPNDSCDGGGSGSGGNTPQVIGVSEHDGLSGLSAPLWARTSAPQIEAAAR